MRAAAVFIVLYLASFCSGHTQTFTHGETTLEVEFVTIGAPGNPDDPTNSEPGMMGSVGYEYQISKFELPCQELNVIMPELGGERSGCSTEDNRPYAVRTGNLAALVVNWMNTTQGYAPAYNIAVDVGLDEIPEWMGGDEGYDPENPMRASGAVYFLPDFDEWHKAAYYDPEAQLYYDYATGSDDVPTVTQGGTEEGTAVISFGNLAAVDMAGGESPFGTVGQTGNASEWEESKIVNRFGDTVQSIRVGNISQNPLDPLFMAANSRVDVTNFGGAGIRVVALPFSEGDFNRDRQVDSADIDALSEHIRSMGTDELYDVNGDGLVDMDDHAFWVEDLKGILHGDADMDGAVEFEDFLQLSASFEMEAGWAGGDFNGDGIAEFDDFLNLSGNFGQAAAVASVPEPSSAILTFLGCLGATVLCRPRRRSIG